MIPVGLRRYNAEYITRDLCLKLTLAACENHMEMESELPGSEYRGTLLVPR
jgi:hypothetical protein